MGTVVKAAACYFALVFVAGVVLGTLRTLLVAPRTGELAAVAFETPLILTVSWIACGWALRVAPAPWGGPRLAMCLIALALLLAAEATLALALGGSASSWLAGLVTPAGLLGLAGQAAYAVFPLVRRPRPAHGTSGPASGPR